MLAFTVSALSASSRPALMQLRGGVTMPSPEQAQTAIAYISLAQASVGHPFTQETMDMYEFTSAVEVPTMAFARFNFALQIAHALMLLNKDVAIPALALAIYASTNEMATALKSPRVPMVGWAALLMGLKHFTDAGQVPEYVIPAILIASGLHGALFWDQCKEMYKIGSVTDGKASKPLVLSQQSNSMGMFVNAAFATAGLYLLGPTLGWSDAQSFGAYGLAYAAFIVKFMKDGEGCFNPNGGYVWAALFGGAGLLSSGLLG
jgi:hypothetical protein